MTKRLYLTGIAVIVTWLYTGESGAASIETLVMPGEVIEGHADLEEECSSCHSAFERARQTHLCLDCHEDVATDVAGRMGFHGLSKEASESACESCHTEHEGRNADIVQLNETTFDHELTDFLLSGKHEETSCDGCHSNDDKHRDAPSQCVDCHEDDNVHGESMGDSCGDCHSSNEWLDVEYDHDTTGYPLVGKHLEAACLDCHADHTFQETPESCYGCHEADDAHDGRSGIECDNCHNPTSWSDTSFNHNRDTNFTLQFRHAELTCDDCHSDDPFADELQTECISCHLEDDNHEGHFGEECGTCHTAEIWETVVFDHDVDTDHPLIGAHVSVECTACHLQPIFEHSPLSACNDCHAEDDPHDGQEGVRCNDCHNEETWQDKVFFDHDLTVFPLLGKHAEAECDGCHDSHVFKDAATACVDCHREEDPHEGRFSDSCGSCHNPVSWEEWQFDHNAQTSFALDGAHVAVACNDCHRQSLSSMSKLKGRCGDCHRADDIHDGEFGFDCARCHTADSFREVRAIR